MRASLDGRWYLLLAVCVGAVFASASCSSDSGKAVSSSGAAGEADAGDDAGGAAGAGGAVGGAAGHSSSATGGASGGEAGAGVAGDTSAAGESGAAGAGDQLVPLPEAEFAATFAKLYCASVAHCCAGGVATCVAKETTDFTKIHDQAITLKNVYDPLKAAECAKIIEALGEGAKCSTAFQSTQASLLPCRGVFDGTVAPGGECMSPADCHQGIGDESLLGGYTGCAPLPLSGGGPKRCRSFVPTATLGDTCLGNGGPFSGTEGVVHFCSHGLSCTSDNKCVSLPTAGQLCPNGSCSDAQCDQGTCVAYRQLGETCDPAPCRLDLNCEANHCVAPPQTSPWILDVGFYGTSYDCPS